METSICRKDCKIKIIRKDTKIYESFKKEEIVIMKPLDIFLFALAVSIDSFSVGLTLNNINKNYLLSALIFSLISFSFTYLGL